MRRKALSRAKRGSRKLIYRRSGASGEKTLRPHCDPSHYSSLPTAAGTAQSHNSTAYGLSGCRGDLPLVVPQACRSPVGRPLRNFSQRRKYYSLSRRERAGVRGLLLVLSLSPLRPIRNIGLRGFPLTLTLSRGRGDFLTPARVMQRSPWAVAEHTLRSSFSEYRSRAPFAARSPATRPAQVAPTASVGTMRVVTMAARRGGMHDPE